MLLRFLTPINSSKLKVVLLLTDDKVMGCITNFVYETVLVFVPLNLGISCPCLPKVTSLRTCIVEKRCPVLQELLFRRFSAVQIKMSRRGYMVAWLVTAIAA